LDDQGGIPGYLLGRHCYVLLRDASGMPYTFGAYDIDNQLTPAKDGDPTSPPGGCGGGLRNSVCVDLPNVPPDIFCTLESSVAAGPHGTYNFVSNNSNLWIHDQLAAAGLTPAFPSTAIMNKAQACAVKPIIFAQLAQAGIQLPVAQRIWAFAFGLTCP